MSALLESYAAGAWFRSDDDGAPLLDASTGEEVARISAKGLDLASMTEHARRVGGPALRELTFHQRALLLKELAKHLSADKDEFYALSLRTGATARDSAVDIDGGFGTVFSYASKGLRELPNDTIVLDGGLEQLGRGGTFVGQHLYTSRPGVAVQINAFNFPVWGMLEKLAPAFLAGLPTIVKPASQTAYLTELVVRRIVESGILPEGTLQLLCGSAGGLLDELGIQDSVAFTGSAHTAGLLRNHPQVLHGGVQLGVEADSLNCSILGPDVTSADPEFDLFVKGVVAEMTVKAGQKCTAIRRAIVPEPIVDEVVAAISARLAKITVGNPAHADVRMGALASLDQREEVRKAVQALRSSAEIVYGDPDRVEVIDARCRAAAPSCPRCCCARPRARSSRTTSSRSARSARSSATTPSTRRSSWRPVGSGSLVGSLVTHDPDVARRGHPRPGAVARPDPGAGPRRRRRVDRPRLAAARAGARRPGSRRWRRGARRHPGRPAPPAAHRDPGLARHGHRDHRSLDHRVDPHCRGGPPVPQVAGRAADRRHDLVGGSRTITLADIEHFADFTGDTFYAHTDAAAAAENPLFGGIVAHGYLIVSLAAGLFVDPDPGPVLANFGVDHLRFLTPVKADDTISVTLTVKQITPRMNADYGEVRWDALVTNADGDPVATYDVLTLVAKTWPV